MNFQNEKIGMMDEGYFVSRGEILTWLNDLLQLNLTKIQQLGSGAVYCQVIDVVHPGKVALNKVNWKAKNDYQFINNYRILQDAFNKIGIKRYLQVEKLAKAKYQDNLEFAQWLKRYYDLNCGDRGSNYLAEERRGGQNPNFGFADKNVVPKTYNASGAVVPKKQSPPKKKEVVVESIPKKPVTPINAQRPGTNQGGSRPAKKSEKKQEIGVGSPNREKSKEKGKTKVVSIENQKIEQQAQLKERQEVENYKSMLIKQREQREAQKEEILRAKEEIQEQKADLQKENEESRNRQKHLMKEVKTLEDKILMIKEILDSEESAQLKVQMVVEVVKLSTQAAEEEEECI